MNFLRLAKRNKEAAPKSWDILRERLIVDKIRNGKTENGIETRESISQNKESALFRKTLKYILDIIQELHEGELDIEEFTKHYNTIESVVAEVDEELNGK